MTAKGPKRAISTPLDVNLLLCCAKLKLQLNCRNICPWIKKFCDYIVLPSFRKWMFYISKACQHTCSDFDLCFILWQEKQGFLFDFAQAFKCCSLALVTVNDIALFGFKCYFLKIVYCK